MERTPLKIFIGYDSNEVVAFHTMLQSIMEYTTIPFEVIPLDVRNLPMYSRVDDGKDSTEFSYTRFLVPYLAGYNGMAVFFDCDMMLREDLGVLVSEVGDKAAYVVKHDYVPKEGIKFLGNVQSNYPRKNWSSVVVWNCHHPANRQVTPELVNTATPSYLHRFSFLKDDEIGELDVRWNWLVGEYEDTPTDVKNVHWTLGGPYFDECRDAEFADEWEVLHNKINYARNGIIW